jgi:hypothetical protein
MADIAKSPTKKLQFENSLKSYTNTGLGDFIRTIHSGDGSLFIEGNYIVKLSDPIYTDGPNYKWIRAHYFAPVKNFFGFQFQTIWVNLCVIWFMSLTLYIMLKFDILRKVIRS